MQCPNGRGGSGQFSTSKPKLKLRFISLILPNILSESLFALSTLFKLKSLKFTS